MRMWKVFQVSLVCSRLASWSLQLHAILTRFAITQSRIENLTRHARNREFRCIKWSGKIAQDFVSTLIDNASQTWTCPHCSKSFVRPDLYKRHLKIHPVASTSRESQERQDHSSRSSVAPSEMGAGESSSSGAHHTTSAHQPNSGSSSSNKSTGDARGPGVGSSRIRRVAELYPIDDEGSDQSQSSAKKSRLSDGRTKVSNEDRESRKDDHIDHLGLYSHASPYSDSVDLVFDDQQRVASTSRGPESMRNGMSDLLHHTSQAGPQRHSFPQQGIEGLTTLARTATDARSPSLRHEPFGDLPIGLPDEPSDRSRGLATLANAGQREKLDNSAGSQSQILQSSGLADRDIFRTAPDQHAALLVGDGQSLEDFSTHVSAPLGSGYASNSMDMQLQSMFVDEVWKTKTEELMAFLAC